MQPEPQMEDVISGATSKPVEGSVSPVDIITATKAARQGIK